MTAPEQLHRCHRGPRCYAREQAGDEWIGSPTDRPLCDVCERAVAQALDESPELYVRLRTATLVRDQGAKASDYVKRSAGSPMPLNGRALDLGEQLAWLLTTWEEIVRDIARCVPPERTGKREGRQVQDASRLLSDHLTAWLAVPATELATSRWTPDTEQSGAGAASALLELRNTIRKLPGLSMQAPRAVRRYDQPCGHCGVRAITHHAGEDLMQCQNCGATERYLPALPGVPVEYAAVGA